MTRDLGGMVEAKKIFNAYKIRLKDAWKLEKYIFMVWNFKAIWHKLWLFEMMEDGILGTDKIDAAMNEHLRNLLSS